MQFIPSKIRFIPQRLHKKTNIDIVTAKIMLILAIIYKTGILICNRAQTQEVGE